MCVQEMGSIKSIVMVGDGATDLEARKEGVADLFIGYGTFTFAFCAVHASHTSAQLYLHDVQHVRSQCNPHFLGLWLSLRILPCHSQTLDMVDTQVRRRGGERKHRKSSRLVCV